MKIERTLTVSFSFSCSFSCKQKRARRRKFFLTGSLLLPRPFGHRGRGGAVLSSCCDRRGRRHRRKRRVLRRASSSSKERNPAPGRPRRWRVSARGTPTRRRGRGRRPAGEKKAGVGIFYLRSVRFFLACLGRMVAVLLRICLLGLHERFPFFFEKPKK